jgi:hypothetical protein
VRHPALGYVQHISDTTNRPQNQTPIHKKVSHSSIEQQTARRVGYDLNGGMEWLSLHLYQYPRSILNHFFTLLSTWLRAGYSTQTKTPF